MMMRWAVRSLFLSPIILGMILRTVHLMSHSINVVGCGFWSFESGTMRALRRLAPHEARAACATRWTSQGAEAFYAALIILFGAMVSLKKNRIRMPTD